MIKESACNAGDTRDVGSILGFRRSPGEGNGNPLQYSCLENFMDRGAWWAAVHGVAKSRTHGALMHTTSFWSLLGIHRVQNYRWGKYSYVSKIVMNFASITQYFLFLLLDHKPEKRWKSHERKGGFLLMSKSQVSLIVSSFSFHYCVVKWQPTPILLLGKSQGWRSIVGYSPWGCKEPDTTGWLHIFHVCFPQWDSFYFYIPAPSSNL